MGKRQLATSSSLIFGSIGPLTVTFTALTVVRGPGSIFRRNASLLCAKSITGEK